MGQQGRPEENTIGSGAVPLGRALNRSPRAPRAARRTRRGPRRTLLAVIVATAVAFGAIALGGIVVGATPFAGLLPASVSCSVTIHHENVANDAVQLAINAYPGGTICLSAGVFPEQLTISASGTTLHGAGASSTIIEPNGPLALNTYDYDNTGYSEQAAAIILVEGSSGTPTTSASGVTIENLQVNGADGQSTFTGCSQGYFGVDFQASSGTLTDAAVTNVALPPALFGCQQGLAVYAYNGYFNYGMTAATPDAVTISHTVISNFDKNAITCDDPMETCTIASNTITGAGVLDDNAQNGVQVAWGAQAAVSSNKVYTTGGYDGAGGCSGATQGAYEVCSGNEGAGILLYDAATGSTVSGNTLSGNEYGIDYFADGLASDGYVGPVAVTISHNTVDSSIAYGIVAEGAPGGGDSITISHNTVDNEASLDASIWGAPGILVDTGNFTLAGNTVQGSSTVVGASDGASQEVCGPDYGATLGPYLDCGTTTNLTTAAIQASSESATNPTNVTLSGTTFGEDSNLIATLGVLGGTTDLLET